MACGPGCIRKPKPIRRISCFVTAKVGTGLTRPDYKAFVDGFIVTLGPNHITDAVIMFGANDDEGLRDDQHKGHAYASPGWIVIWGAMHGAVLVAEHAVFKGKLRDALSTIPQKILATALTFQFVTFTWIFFRAASFGQALSYFSGFSRISAPVTMATPFNLTLLAAAMCLHFLPPDWVKQVEFSTRRVPLIVMGALAGALMVVIDSLGPWPARSHCRSASHIKRHRRKPWCRVSPVCHRCAKPMRL